MDAFEYQAEYELDGAMDLDTFLEEHGEHEIIVCEEALHQWPISPDELRQRCGGSALVEYLGEESPHYLDNNGLFFVVKPTTKKGLPRKKGEPMQVVVYVQ